MHTFRHSFIFSEHRIECSKAYFRIPFRIWFSYIIYTLLCVYTGEKYKMLENKSNPFLACLIYCDVKYGFNLLLNKAKQSNHSLRLRKLAHTIRVVINGQANFWLTIVLISGSAQTNIEITNSGYNNKNTYVVTSPCCAELCVSAFYSFSH